MEYLDQNSKINQIRINQWNCLEGKDQVKGSVLSLRKIPSEQISSLSQLFIGLSQDNSIIRLKSEFKLLEKIFNTARYQIRSFTYVSSIKKFKQLVKRFINLKIPEILSSLALECCSSYKLMTLSTFRSLQWRLLAGYEMIKEIEKQCHYFIELATQEMTTSIFLHYPIAFVSVSSSISCLSKEIKSKILSLFMNCRTYEMKSMLPFPNDNEIVFPQLPSDPSLIVDKIVVDSSRTTIEKPIISKIDISNSIKPSANQRDTMKITQKPKSSLASLGF